MPTFNRKMLMSSLLDNINRLTQNTDSKLIFKTELNSLEITRLKPPPYTHQIGTDFSTEFSLIPESSVQFLENPEYPDSSTLHADLSTLYPDSPTQSPDSSLLIHDFPTVVADSTSNRTPRYTCQKCNYTTQKKSNYTTHLKCVHLKEKFPCGICHRLFSNLPQHMRVAHATTQGKLLNEKIRENISENLNSEDLGLKSHLALVPSATVITSGYSCKLCSQHFATKSDLSLHRKTHKANIKRECEICKKLYSNLEQHVKIVHRKIKNFECVNCRKRFYDNRELRNHHLKSLQTGLCQTISTDQGGKRFPCDQCEYKSKTKTNLTLHIESIHLGIKYTCPACFTQVSSRPNLNSHMKHCKLRDHGERESRRILFQCKLCEYSTPRAGHLDRHILSVHGTEALETVTSVYEASTKIGSAPAPTHPSCKIPFKLPQFFNLVNLENIEGLLDMEFMSSNVHLLSPDGSGFQSTAYLNSLEHSNGIQDDFSERTRENYILNEDLETPRSDPNFLHPAGDGLGEEGVGHHNMEEVQPVVDISTHRPLKISLQDLDGLELMPLIPDGETETEKSSPFQSTIRPVVSSPEFILQEVDQTGFRDHHPTFQSGLQVSSLSSTKPSGHTSQSEDINSEAACNPGLVVLNIRSISSLEDANTISVPVLGDMTRMSGPAMEDATGRSVPALENVTGRSFHALEDVTGRTVLSIEDATERSAHSMENVIGRSVHALEDVTGRSFLSMEDASERSTHAMENVTLTSVSSVEDKTERVIPPVEFLQRSPSRLDGDYSSRVSNQSFLYEI